MKNREPERYSPIFEGPSFDIALNITQFRSNNIMTPNETDIYFNYALPVNDRAQNVTESYNHTNGIFFFDEDYAQVYKSENHFDSHEAKQLLEISDSLKVIANSAKMTFVADSGSMAFEVMRDYDKGLSSNHGSFKIKHFPKNRLSISDIILATSLSFEGDENLLVSRDDITFIPNPLSTFKTSDDVFLYFEIYGLGLDVDQLTHFDQRITITKLEQTEGSAINFFRNLFGFGKEEKQITIENSYETDTKDTPIYLQLDLSKYEAGEYRITITIIDNINGQNVTEKTLLYLKQ